MNGVENQTERTIKELKIDHGLEQLLESYKSPLGIQNYT